MNRFLVLVLLIFTGMALDAFSDPSSGGQYARYLMDCNNNGIADSLDLTWGTLEDFNRNGRGDACDADSGVRSFHYSGWKGLAAQPDTVFLGVWYQRDSCLIVRYTVPPGRHRTVVVAIDSVSGRTTKLLEKVHESGAYTLPFIPTTPDARRQMSGRSVIRASIGTKVISMPVAWRWSGWKSSY